MEIWIWITLVAATTQTLRSAGQKQMKSVMGDFGASYIRFSYALRPTSLYASFDLQGFQLSLFLTLHTLK